MFCLVHFDGSALSKRTPGKVIDQYLLIGVVVYAPALSDTVACNLWVRPYLSITSTGTSISIWLVVLQLVEKFISIHPDIV